MRGKEDRKKGENEAGRERRKVRGRKERMPGWMNG